MLVRVASVASHVLVFSLFVDSVLVVQPLVRFVDNFDQSLVCFHILCLDQWDGVLCLCFVHPSLVCADQVLNSS